MEQKRRYWQQAAGDQNRNYVDLCLKWGVILNGHGLRDPWSEEAAQKMLAIKKDGNSRSRAIAILRRFCEEMKEGDLVVLRMGTSEIHGVGEIVGGYIHDKNFLDIDGWHLPHVRRVRWFWKAENKPKVWDTYTLKQGDTTQEISVNDKTTDMMAWIDSIIPSNRKRSEIPVLPQEKLKKLGESEVGQKLFDYGLGSGSVSDLTRSITDLARLAEWYDNKEYVHSVSEAETVAHLITPLLRALGWTPQKIELERKTKEGRIDVALFKRTPREPENISMIIEAKKLDSACLTAFDQAHAYAHEFPNCRRLVVSNGIRYAVFLREEEDTFSSKPAAYMNLSTLLSSYPIYACEGADEALLYMSNEWQPGLSPKRVGDENEDEEE